MTDQSSGSPARGRRRTPRRPPEVPEARSTEEPRVNEDDFGAGVDDPPEPWEARAEAFDAGPDDSDSRDRDLHDREMNGDSNRDSGDRDSGNRDRAATAAPDSEGASRVAKGSAKVTAEGVTIGTCRAAAAVAVAAVPPEDRADTTISRRRDPHRAGRVEGTISSTGSAEAGRSAGDRWVRRSPAAASAPQQWARDADRRREGVLELHPKGYGFLRDIKKDYAAQETDPFVSSSLIEKYSLTRNPDPRRSGARLQLAGSATTDDRLRRRPLAGGLCEDQEVRRADGPSIPFEHIKLETGPQPVSMRVMDLLTPIGKGQRGLDRGPAAEPARPSSCSRSPTPSAAKSPRSASDRAV